MCPADGLAYLPAQAGPGFSIPSTPAALWNWLPWADERQAGLVFVAFGHSFDAFEALLNRMAGKDDG
ncbi:MAG: hypothetical protein ABW079_17485, partial [Sedimenticola sp.]